MKVHIRLVQRNKDQSFPQRFARDLAHNGLKLRWVFRQASVVHGRKLLKANGAEGGI
jgi:hypothetical protein